MGKPNRPQSGRTNLASCIVATIFLIFIAMVILIVFFTLFKPKDPKISVNAVRLPSFSISNATSSGGAAVVSFTFSLYAAVSNPNRAAVFNHYDSSLQLLYSGNQVGFMFVPAGRIAAGHTVYMSATFSVQSFPVNPSGFGVGPVLEMEARLRLAGRLQILHFFNHHVDARALCRVGVSATDGSVIGFRC
ncbi:hypothetical protein Scep_006019 [Stephania cephalantha]|uniref:Late embryogenesis abundant protein LEA-2 subgroup domain-containing protein n=1 Tax=Stephania cephalantha TaxID=152367 RepID=A0AAP0PKG1_9MAGN